ncbi:hypothetical protein Tco_1262621, partial [Tanacetum coccineum]
MFKESKASRHVKRGRDTKIPQSSGPPEKVGDEAVHKELGDRMERVATTASSLEAEQDSGSGPRCQDTILGDVNAQTRFEIASKQSNDPPLSRGYTLGSGEDSMKLLELMEFCTQLSYKNRKSVLFLLLVYFTAAKLMLGSVNVVRHMLMLPVQVPAEIIDFLKSSSVHYAFTVNPIIYTSCIKQFWATAKSSIRRDLHLDDAEGTDLLPTATIFEELARMGYEKPSQKLTFYKAFFSPQWKYFIHTITQCLSAKSTAWNEFSFFINQQLGNMSTHKKICVNPFHTMKVFADMKRAGKDFSRRITPLFATMMVQASKEVGEDSGHPTDSTQVPILDQPSTSSKPKKKQPSKKTQRQEVEVSQDETEHEESVPIPSNDLQPRGEDSMQLTNLMVFCTKLQTQVLDLEKAKDAQAKEIVALKKRIQRLERNKMSRPTGLKRLKKVGMSRRVESFEDQESLVAPEDASKQGRSIADIDDDVEATLVDETQERQDDELITAGEAVTTSSVEDSAAPTTIEEITLAQTLIQIKAAKPKVVTTAATTTTTTRPKAKRVVVQEPSEFRVPQEAQPSISKDRGKGIMIEPEVPLKRKDQIALDEQITRDIQAKLNAKLIEEQKIARKQEEEANIALIESWENTQAMMEADRLLAERLQSKERDELIDEEKGKLFIELMEKRKSKEKKVEGSEQTAKSSRNKMLRKKRVGKEQQQESSKKQRIEEDKESDEFKEVSKDNEDDEGELMKHLVIKKDEDIAIDAIPLVTKLSMIIDYKLHKEGMLVHYQLIRADGSSKRYSSMIRMPQGIDREDLEALWRIVKTKYSDIRPEDEFERVLWGDLKVMFEPDKRSDVWRILQGYRVTIWKLINSSGVHF